MKSIMTAISDFLGVISSAKVAIFWAEYLRRPEESESNLITKKLGFGLNFMIPGVLGAEIGRFLSYSACKMAFLQFLVLFFAS